MWTYNNNKLNKNSPWTHISSSFCTVTFGVHDYCQHTVYDQESCSCASTTWTLLWNEQLILHLSTQLFWFYNVVGSRQLVLTMQPAYLSFFKPKVMWISIHAMRTVASCTPSSCKYWWLAAQHLLLVALNGWWLAVIFWRLWCHQWLQSFWAGTIQDTMLSHLACELSHFTCSSTLILLNSSAQQCEMAVLYLQATLWQTSNHRVS